MLQDFFKKHPGQMDQALWNSFITAAGRASQMDRAVDTLEQMEVTLACPVHIDTSEIQDDAVQGLQGFKRQAC